MKFDSEKEAELAEIRKQEFKTKRPTVPALEEKLFEPIPCLDYGFVRLIDYMGDDAAIVQAARVSYGKGTKSTSNDRGLLRYLIRNRHTSPFEMNEIKLHVKMPMFVARQWIRHRTACLAGDSVLSFDLPGAEERGRRQHYGMRMDEFYDKWVNGAEQIKQQKKKPLFLERVEKEKRYTISELKDIVERTEETLRSSIRDGYLKAEKIDGRIYILGSDWYEYGEKEYSIRMPMKERLAGMKLRMCDEETGEILHTNVKDIWQSGVKKVFKVTLENGKSLKMSKDHRCLTKEGWKTLEKATMLVLRSDDGVTWNTNAPEFAVNGIALYKSEEWLRTCKENGMGVQEMADQAEISYHSIRKYLQKYGLQFTASERSRLSGFSQRGQKRQMKTKRVLTSEHIEAIRKARSGANSNFWKGGVSSVREGIGRWTTEQAHNVHEENDFSCVICSGKKKLEAHHIDPVWNNIERAKDRTNLISLCGECHSNIHNKNLELSFLEDVQEQRSLDQFWERYGFEKRERSAQKKTPQPRKLARTWSKIVSIEYVGEEMTYDLEVTGPYHNFVANGFIVHNSVNEISARYSILDKEFYLPSPEDMAVQSKNNKQGRGEVLDPAQAAMVLQLLKQDALGAYDTYEKLLGEEFGLARELARMNLPVSWYTQWYWKIDLHNLLHFLSLRMDAHAQYEIRVFADAIATLVADWVPNVWEAFQDYRLGGTFISKQEVEILKLAIQGEKPSFQDAGVSKREWRALCQKFGLDLKI